ncbi:MAG: TSUP family transporter [Alphaproteobacteria bacterium]|nr:TSUP family transporter [Alphaproteobacteria bacterium]
MTPAIALTIIATSLGTAFLSGIFGMLGGVILMALLVSLLPTIGAAFVLHGLIQLTSNGFRAFLNRADIQWRIIALFLVGGVGALALLSLVRFAPDKAVVLLSLGLLPFAAAAIPKSLALNAERPAHALLSGLTITATSLLTGVGGPLLDVFYQRTSLTRHQVVATKAVAQALAHIAKIIYFGVLVVNANNNFPDGVLLGVCVITTMIGTTFGKRVLDNMADATFFRWTGRIIYTLGVILIVRAIMVW